MRPIKSFIVCISFASLMQSCSEQKTIEKKVESEIKTEPVARQEDIIEAAREQITKSPNLTDEQKKRLISIQEKSSFEINALKDEINKARMVLIKAAFEPSYNAREVEILKKKILGLERKKLRVGLNAFTEARNVIDPNQVRATKALNKVFFNEYYPPY